MREMSMACFVAAVLAVAAIAPTSHAQSFEGLGDLGGDVFDSQADGVSADGSIVVGRSTLTTGPLGRTLAFRWTAETGMVSLGAFPGDNYSSYAYAASADGSVVVGYGHARVHPTTTAVMGFRWTASGGMQEIGSLSDDFPSDIDSKAFAVSADGNVIVGESQTDTGISGNEQEAFRWTAGGMQPLGTLGGSPYQSQALGVSADGSVVVGYSQAPAGREAFRWTQGDGMQGLGELTGGAYHSLARAVSADGTVIVGSSTDEVGVRAFRWTADGGMQQIGNIQPYAVSADGSVIVGFHSVGGAYVWTETEGWRTIKGILENAGLDLGDWRLSSARGISADGTVVVGGGRNPNGDFEAWRAVLPKAETEDIVVTSTGDEGNEATSQAADICDVDLDQSGRQCTLRAAIEVANARGGGKITFDIPGDGVPTITIANLRDDGRLDVLPAFEHPFTVDGTTQSGGFVELAGIDGTENCSFPDECVGIKLKAGAGGSVVRGMVIHGFAIGLLAQNGADDILIENNRIGTDPTGLEWRGNAKQCDWYPWIGTTGVSILGNRSRILDNIIAGNVYITMGTTGNCGLELPPGYPVWGADLYLNGNDHVVQGNRIGVGADGNVLPIPPYSSEIPIPSYFGTKGIVAEETSRLLIGGETGGAGPPGTCESPCNIIAGHNAPILIRNSESGAPTANTTITGNLIGVDAGRQPAFTGNPRGGMLGVAASGERDRVIHNYVYSSNVGIEVSGSESHVIGNEVFGLKGQRAGFADQYDAAVRVSGTGNEVRDNLLHSTSTKGVIVFGTANTVAENEIYGHRMGGVWVLEGAGHRIEANDIYDNERGGVVVYEYQNMAVPYALISRNRIHNNAIGIDLGDRLSNVEDPHYGWILETDGVTLNDLLDSDSGPNDLQNFPIILAATYGDEGVRLEGFFETPLTSTATYTLEVFSNRECAFGFLASWGGWRFGEGEHFLGTGEATARLGDAEFDVSVGAIPEGHRYVTATATDRAAVATSEFSRCVPLADASRTARAEVDPGKTGIALDALGVTVTVTQAAASAGNRARPSGSEAGTLYVTRHEMAPDTSFFADTTATAPGGSAVRPEAVAARYWFLADRGLTAAGGAEGSTAAFEICLDPTGVVLPASLTEVVLVQRNEASEGLWRPHATYSRDHNGTTYLCAIDLTSLGEFGLGALEGSLPVWTAEAPGVPVEAFALGAAYPNPFGLTTTLDLTLPASVPVTVAVYDVLGREVSRLHDGPLAAGEHALRLDASALPAGVYLVRVVSPTGSTSRRVTLVR